MNAKKLSVSIFLIIFIIFGVISTLLYDSSYSVGIICYENSYAEEYAKEHDIPYVKISDSDAYIGVLNLENFDYNVDGGKGEIVSYNGDSEKIAIPTDIEGIRITKVCENAFENAKNLKTVYLPKSVTEFEPKDIDGVTVYMYEDTELYRTLFESKKVTEDTEPLPENENTQKDAEILPESEDTIEDPEASPENREIKYEIKTTPDSYYVDFYSSNIPFSYDNISNKTIDITMYSAHQSTVVIPESINGKIVTSISLDVFEDGIDTIIIPATVTNIEKDLFQNRYDIYFLIGLLMALIGTIFAMVIVLTLKVTTKEKTFLRVSQFRTAYILSVLSMVLAGLYMFVYAIPEWLIFTLFVIVCGVSALSVIKANTAVALVEGVDEKIKEQTQVFKTLTVDAEHLLSTCKSTELKTEVKKVYEAIRYSDPMSNEALADIEGQIQSEFTFFSQAIKSEDLELAKSVADGLINLIDGRNKKCKVIK